ncbi:hypothetical protein JCM16106_17510 [Hydrogenophilus islandicus]
MAWQRFGWVVLGATLWVGASAAEERGCAPERRDGVVWRPWHEVAQPLVREAPAKVTPMETTTVAAEVAGRVMALPVRVGDRVRAGR